MSTCPKCGRQLRDGLIFCIYCGQKLVNTTIGSTVSVKLPETEAQHIDLPPVKSDEPMSLLVRFMGTLQPISLPDKAHVVLGRHDLESHSVPDIDLSAFDALELGVSRLHAMIDCSTGLPSLGDLDSRNGTDLNGVRLVPHELHRLRHNDVICLGKLVLYVRV
jgi:hypothetical protein